MATVTIELGSFDERRVLLQVDYDDILLRLLVVRCINNTNFPARGTATAVPQPNRTYTATFPANQTTELNIPQNAANRLDITIDSRGRVDGVDYQFLWPA